MNRTRSADQGNGTYKNPILFGQYSDPSIFREGEDYYMMVNFDTLFHSKDLIHWEHLYHFGEKFKQAGVEPWAPDILKYGDTYYYYGFSPCPNTAGISSSL